MMFSLPFQYGNGDEKLDEKLKEMFIEYHESVYHYKSPQNSESTRQSEKEKALNLTQTLLDNGDRVGELFFESLYDLNQSDSYKSDILNFMRFHRMRISDTLEYSRKIVDEAIQSNSSTILFISCVQTLSEFGEKPDLELLEKAKNEMGFSRIVEISASKLEARLKSKSATPPSDNENAIGEIEPGPSGRNLSTRTVELHDIRPTSGKLKWAFILGAIALLIIVVILVRATKSKSDPS